LQLLHQLRLIHPINELFIEYRRWYPQFFGLPFYANLAVSQEIANGLGITVAQVALMVDVDMEYNGKLRID
jgi:hypothetical protein